MEAEGLACPPTLADGLGTVEGARAGAQAATRTTTATSAILFTRRIIGGA